MGSTVATAPGESASLDSGRSSESEAETPQVTYVLVLLGSIIEVPCPDSRVDSRVLGSFNLYTRSFNAVIL